MKKINWRNIKKSLNWQVVNNLIELLDSKKYCFKYTNDGLRVEFTLDTLIDDCHDHKDMWHYYTPTTQKDTNISFDKLRDLRNIKINDIQNKLKANKLNYNFKYSIAHHFDIYFDESMLRAFITIPYEQLNIDLNNKEFIL